ncbi:hypothetical protein Btru_012501 [Bulinus truncatus]|nr:hypothetical protein Btru_012501 [Bulinus truncatus]
MLLTCHMTCPRLDQANEFLSTSLMDMTFTSSALLTATIVLVLTIPCAGQEVNKSSAPSHTITTMWTDTSRTAEESTASRALELSTPSPGKVSQSSQRGAKSTVTSTPTFTTTVDSLLPPPPPPPPPMRLPNSHHTHAAPPRVELKTAALVMMMTPTTTTTTAPGRNETPAHGRGFAAQPVMQGDSTTAAAECADSQTLINGMYTCRHYISIQDLLCSEPYYKKLCCDSCKEYTTPAAEKKEEDPVADRCLDEQHLINDIATCSQIVSNTPNLCYFDVYKVKCCNSCKEAKVEEQKGCEYSDKIPGCRRDSCDDVRELCCDTCTSDTPRTINYCAYITKDSSPELCQNPSSCLDELFKQHCCQSCGPNRQLASVNSSVTSIACTSFLLLTLVTAGVFLVITEE